MSDTVSGDGYLARDGETFGLSFGASELSPDMLAAALERPHTLDQANRSALGQLGLETVTFGDPELNGDRLIVPLQLIGHTEVARQLIKDLEELPSVQGEIRYSDQPLRFGRLIDTQRLDRLTVRQLENAIENKFLYPGEEAAEGTDWKVTDNGTLWVRLAPIEFIRHEGKLADKRARMNILHHGRAGLAPYVDDVPIDLAGHSLQAFFVGGVKLSPGPYDVKIQPIAFDDGDNNRSYQPPSASFIDGGRIMGISSRHRQFDSHRQVELVTQGKVLAGDVWVKVNAFHPDGANRERSFSVNWSSLTPEERVQIHHEGISVVDAIRATDPTVLHNLMRHVTDAHPAYVVSHQGVTPVARERTRRFQAQSIADAVHSHGESRTIPDDYSGLESVVRALGPAGDRSRLVVARDIDPATVDEISANGEVRAVLAKGYGPLSMTKETHMMLRRATDRDVKLMWQDPECQIRIFESGGHWVMPHVLNTYRSPDISLAFYTSHIDAVGEALREPVGEFLDSLTRLADPGRIIIHHGNGSGGMAMVSEETIARLMVSAGTGIDLEGQGQYHTGKYSAQVVADYVAIDRLYRQHGMDMHNTIPLFNTGGNGTLEELAISLCTHKLLQCLPAPKIVVDESGIFRGVKQTIDMIAEASSITIYGTEVDLGGKTLGPPWLPSTVHMVTDYSEPTRIIDEFSSNPLKYWGDRGITEDMLAIALANQEQDVGRYGLVIPRPLRQALSGVLG